ncbi:hypothetical protein [Kangiella sp. TOML190]|uniref:hypothetical protein n=1 Tax=Kangiella sp. TOML190 TaxID=2931351 RepID=UPI00203B39E7|nr:hypothetical protein [Kangiella sp. TOML190]
MNITVGFTLGTIHVLLYLAFTIIFKIQNRGFYFHLTLILFLSHGLSRFYFFPLLEHPFAQYHWYPFWIGYNLPFLFFISFSIYKYNRISLSVVFLSMLIFSNSLFYGLRFFERHYTDSTVVKSIFPYWDVTTVILIAAILTSEAFSGSLNNSRDIY